MSQLSKKDRKIVDSKAQLLIMKNELKVVSDDIDQKLKLKKQLENNIIVLTEKKESLEKTNLQFLISNKEHNRIVELREANIQKKENDLNNRSIQLDKYIADQKYQINQIQKLFDENLHTLKNEIYSKTDELEKLDNNILAKKEILSTLDGKIFTSSKELQTINDKIYSQQAHYQNLIVTTEKHIAEKNVILKNITEKILIEQQKIEGPKNALLLEEKRIDNKRKNLDILIDRFKKYMKVYFPNQEIKL